MTEKTEDNKEETKERAGFSPEFIKKMQAGFDQLRHEEQAKEAK